MKYSNGVDGDNSKDDSMIRNKLSDKVIRT